MPENDKAIDEIRDVVDPSEKEDEEVSSAVRYSVTSYGADYPVDGLVKRLLSEDVSIPDFQREYVWTSAQASRFIESLLLGLPVPGIFLSKEPDSQKFLVIDGQQRLKTLRFFYEGILRAKEFSLKGVESEFEGMTYKTLPEADRRRLDDSIIHATVIRQEDPKGDQTSIYHVFERLNTMGTPLSSQEIRICVSHGTFASLLRDLNKIPEWRTIYGIESNRAKDQELILRFFALYFDLPSYKRPLKDFLNGFMTSNRNLERVKQDELVRLFTSTVAFLAKNLTPKHFRPERGLNASVLDALMVATARRLAKGPVVNTSAFTEAASQLVQQADFLNKCQFGTTHQNNISERITLASGAFESVK